MLVTSKDVLKETYAMFKTRAWAKLSQHCSYFCGMPVIVTAGVIDVPSSGPDHNSITVALFVIGVVISLFGTMVWGWFKNVNDSFKELNTYLREESRSREERWDALHKQCNKHGERISRIEGRLKLTSEMTLLGRGED